MKSQHAVGAEKAPTNGKRRDDDVAYWEDSALKGPCSLTQQKQKKQKKNIEGLCKWSEPFICSILNYDCGNRRFRMGGRYLSDNEIAWAFSQKKKKKRKKQVAWAHEVKWAITLNRGLGYGPCHTILYIKMHRSKYYYTTTEFLINKFLTRQKHIGYEFSIYIILVNTQPNSISLFHKFLKRCKLYFVSN